VPPWHIFPALGYWEGSLECAHAIKR
jgi:hypothetical protein